MNKQVLIKLAQVRLVINHVLRQRGLIKRANPAVSPSLARTLWDWYMKAGTGKTGFVNLWNGTHPYPNEDDTLQRTVDTTNGILQTGIGVGGILDMIPLGLAGITGIGTTAGFGAWQRHLNNRYGDMPQETQRLTEENSDKLTGQAIMNYSNQTGKPWHESNSTKDRQAVAKIKGDLIKNKYSGVNGVLNTSADAAKIYGRTLDNVGRNYTGPALYRFGKFLYNLSDPWRIVNRDTTWDREKHYKELEKQIQERSPSPTDNKKDTKEEIWTPSDMHPEFMQQQFNWGNMFPR